MTSSSLKEKGMGSFREERVKAPKEFGGGGITAYDAFHSVV